MNKKSINYFENYRIVKTNNLEYLQFNKLLEYQDDLSHALFLKTYDTSFSLDYNTNLRENTIKKISKEFNIPLSNFVQAHQKHTNNIEKLDSTNIQIYNNVDGFETNKKNIASIITFADCMPILLYDPLKKVYSNIHSGWKGVVKKIALVGVSRLISDYGSNVKDIICLIGPNIHKENFLVNDDVKNLYESNFDNELLKKYNIIEKTDFSNEIGIQYRIDNNLLIELLLKEIGLQSQNIINCNICTFKNNNLFHSRRSNKNNHRLNGCFMLLK